MSRIIACRAAFVACAALAPVALGSTAGAQSPRPSPTPAPTPVAFSARAHTNITVTTQGGAFDGSLQLGVAQRANQTRIDVLSVKSDTLPIPPIGLTAVIDRTANTITIWNDVSKTYRVQSFIPRASGSPSPRPSSSPRMSASPAAPVRHTSPLANIDLLSLTMKMTGHTTTSGLPTTGLSFDLQVQRKGDKTMSHVMATTQLADEFLVFPMTLDVSVEPGMVPFTAKLSYAVDQLTRETPAASQFAVPAGYTEAKSIPEVIFQRGMPMSSGRSPSPSPR